MKHTAGGLVGRAVGRETRTVSIYNLLNNTPNVRSEVARWGPQGTRKRQGACESGGEPRKNGMQRYSGAHSAQ